ncbi:ABC transporter ATP-binding protein [Sulfurovum sp.]|jgi:putative ABC transport system ATP-binding protein|uniref:ABC transporter ATP-binding protein n=1 Tax=Sulfurovum sp. TaxID=1969726 RepID=UPI002A366884|nr:ABC transporter ATP-binding protein [Sulfurovum sp.]MDD2450932.1 ABC transporter ATP-binding protein [Sulfurovum sp.]MDD3499049.1 ABC transporter ATP-binding protein [Sulfurovum sp.]MDY0403171.1 ABC transporter ATP-binding protein [Sulfurovum sp.]
MISLKKISKVYGSGDAASTVLHEIDLEIEEGEFVAIMGPSGSGKSTLLNILGTLDVPSSGQYTFLDTEIGALSPDQRALFRRSLLGFIFQGYNLLKKTTSIENVEMPLIYQGIDSKTRRERAIEALKEVGLEDRLSYDPGQLSGGQQQRVAIARAMVTRPRILIADEPTGNLDTKRGHEIMELIRTFNQQGITVIMVTHEDDIAAYASRTIYLRDGVIEKEVKHVS